MKNRILIIFSIFCMSCGEDFLELVPESEASRDIFYNSAGDMETAVLAAYDALQSGTQYGSSGTDEFGGNFYALMEVRGDNVVDGSPTAGNGIATFEINAFSVDPANPILSQSWGGLYQGIQRCNIVLDKIDEISMDEALRNQFKGEVSFIRALSYFNLVRLWGKVPLVLKVISTQESRSTQRDKITDIYATIIADLKFAASNLPSSYGDENMGRVTSDAAKALLGKVYLTMQDFDLASAVLEEVIQLNSYHLLDNIADVFDANNPINDEVIFSVRFQEGGAGEGNSGFGTPDLSNLKPIYDMDDARSALLDLRPETSAGGEHFTEKFFAPPSPAGDRGPDLPVLRYAGVLLMAAEALNEIGYIANGKAFDYLNKVRTRADLAALTSAELPDQASFREAVYLQRRLEFPLELHRWFTLVRTGRAIQAMSEVGINIQKFQLLYPIPRREIDVYNDPEDFPQNSGY